LSFEDKIAHKKVLIGELKLDRKEVRIEGLRQVFTCEVDEPFVFRDARYFS